MEIKNLLICCLLIVSANTEKYTKEQRSKAIHSFLKSINRHRVPLPGDPSYLDVHPTDDDKKLAYQGLMTRISSIVEDLLYELGNSSCSDLELATGFYIQGSRQHTKNKLKQSKVHHETKHAQKNHEKHPAKEHETKQHPAKHHEIKQHETHQNKVKKSAKSHKESKVHGGKSKHLTKDHHKEHTKDHKNSPQID